jgi:hypothetical protein
VSLPSRITPQTHPPPSLPTSKLHTTTSSSPPPPSTSHCITAVASVTSHDSLPLRLPPPVSGLVSVQPSPFAGPTRGSTHVQGHRPLCTRPARYSTHKASSPLDPATRPDPFRHETLLCVFLQTSDSISGTFGALKRTALAGCPTGTRYHQVCQHFSSNHAS